MGHTQSHTQEVDLCVSGESFAWIEIISIIISCISLLIILLIGYSSIPQLNSLSKLEISFKYLFYLSWISSIIVTILTLLSTFLCIYSFKFPSTIIITIAIYFYYILLLSLLATLITRLHFTFIDSIYKITNKTRKILFIFFIIVIILIIFNILFDIISWFDTYLFNQNYVQYSTLSIIFGALAIFSYTLTALYAMSIFANNLIKLTHLQATSPPTLQSVNNSSISIQGQGLNNDDSSTGSRSSSFMIPSNKKYKYKLNQTQKDLIENISKYVSLLIFAMISSLIVAIAILCGIWIKNIIFRQHFFQIILIFTNLDCGINIICLYLQYSFAVDNYHKYCKCIHLLSRKLLRGKAKRSGQKKYRESIEISIRNNNHHINNNKDNKEDINDDDIKHEKQQEIIYEEDK